MGQGAEEVNEQLLAEILAAESRYKDDPQYQAALKKAAQPILERIEADVLSEVERLSRTGISG
jgi:hypothetical protein